MPLSTRDSDEDFEPKAVTRNQARLLLPGINPVTNSPLRRSSRIKQSKYSPGSESDSSIGSNQTTRSTRTQTANIDLDTMKKTRTRKNSVSSEISEVDVESLGTPKKRITRQSGSLLGTPVRITTRAASKRFTRSGSEAKSPTRITRSTRASSVDPEFLPNRSKSQSSTPVKTRRRASMLPLSSLSKEKVELKDRIPYVKLDATIVETDEITTSGNSDSSPDKALRNIQSEKNKKHQSLEKDEIEENSNQTETLIESKSVILQLSEEKDERQSENLDSVTTKNTSNIAGEASVDSFNSSSQKDEKSESAQESLLELEKSLVDICVSTQVETVPENLSDITIEEQKSNKENQMLNIISDVSLEKSMSKVIPSSVKSLASPFLNKSSNEKETKSMRKELNSSKRRYSRASTEIAIKHNDLLKETADSSPEKMDISVESSSPIATNKSVLSQHDNTELADEVINKDESIENLFSSNEDTEMIRKKIDQIKDTVVDSKDSNKTESNEEDEMFVENVNISISDEDATEIISELDKIDKIEDTVADSKDSNQMESNEEDKISFLAQSKQLNDSRESLISATDDNEMKLTLEERSPSREKNEVLSSLAHSKPDESADLQILPPINESSDDQATTMNKSTQDKVVDSSDTEQEQENLPIHVIELVPRSSNAVLETNNSARNILNDETTQDDKFFNKIKTSKTSAIDTSPKKVDTEDSFLEKRAKRSLKRKSIDNLKEERNLKIVTSQKDQEDMEIADNDSDISAGIDLFQDIPADKWKEKNDVKIDPVQTTSQSVEEVENENETDGCELLLANKEAWLAAESIKAAKVTESFECDSDDTVDMLWKSQSDASRVNYSIEKSETSSNADLMDIDDEKNEKQIKKRKSRTDKRLTAEIDQDSPDARDEVNSVNTDESLNKSKTALNRTNELNKPVRSARTKQPSKANKDSKDEFKYENEEIEDDLSESNKRSLINKKNILLHKSMERTLNKSLKDTFVQSNSTKKAQVDNSEEKPDNTDVRTEKELDKKKHSLNKSYNKERDNDATKFEKNVLNKDNGKKKENLFLNRSVDQESKSENIEMIHLTNDESDDSDVNIAVMDLGSTTYSMIANVGSNNEDSEDSDDSDDSDDNDQQEHIPSFLFAKAKSDSEDDNSSDSDIKREYNLDGVEQKFSDDDAVADECRDSEVEFSDPDDNGSDLEDFIVDDDEMELEEEDEEEDDSNEDNDDKEDLQDLQEDAEKEEDEENKQIHMKLENMEKEKEKDDEQENDEEDTVNKKNNENKFAEMKAISSKDATFHKKLPKVHDNENKTATHTLLRTNETEMNQDIKMKKSNLKKREKINLLDSSNSNLSVEKKKKKSLTKENETILFSNLISSSIEKRRKSDPQYFSKNNAERRYSSGQLNEFEISMSAPKLSKHISIEFNTPKHNTSKKLGLDKTLELYSESKNKLDMTKVMQTSAMKEKSKKDLASNECISLRLFNDADKEKMSTSDFSPDLLKLLKNTHFSKSTPSKKESRKTMNINIETPTIKHLRKEKLNESAPILTLNQNRTEIGSLQKQLCIKNKDNAQIKVKEKNNEDEVPETLSDDTIKTKHSKKKKHKEQESPRENMSDKIVADNILILNGSEKKKPVKRTQLTSVENDTCKDAYQISEKKKKKQDTSKKNIFDKILSEGTAEVNVPKKKKRVKLSQLTVVKDNCENVLTISEIQKRRNKLFARHDDILEDAYEFVQKQEEKQEKKKQKSKEEITESAGEFKISKKKHANLDQLFTVQNITDKALSEDVNVISKKKKHVKFPQLTIADDDIRKDICQSIEKMKKKKKRDTSKENIADKALSKDLMKVNVPKKKKRIKLAELDIVEDNTLEDECQIIEKKKKKKKGKKQDTSKDNSTDKDEDIEINIPKKKKNLKFSQSSTVKDDTQKDAHQINEKQKKKKKQRTSEEAVTEEVLFEDAAQLKIPKKKKKNKLAIVQNDIPENTYEFNQKKKKNIKLSDIQVMQYDIFEDAFEFTEKLEEKRKQKPKKHITASSENVGELKISKKKKHTNLNKLVTVENNTSEETCQIIKREKKKKKNRIDAEPNINEDAIFQKIVQNNMELQDITQYKKKTINLDSPVNKQEKLVKKKAKRQETVPSIDTLRTEKKKHTLPIQIPVSKLKSEKMLMSNKLQKTALGTSESKNATYSTKKLKEAAKTCMPKELNMKKKRRFEDTESEIHNNLSTKKSKKEVKEVNKFLPSSSGVKRLSNDVIDHLTDMPTRARKKQKISQNEEKISSVKNKSKAATIDRDLVKSSTSSCITQFRIINVQDTKKPMKTAAAVASFRQRMLARNEREPTSTYLIYQEKNCDK
ncbi:titin homolog [Monomorium pharaonis]|uniref:titin homolog n=1 Tax=Monomorium pharaonis TaxID=307658 RepID=UPI00063F632E|nr:titin homolog [Monomorium pharaonis]